MLVWLSFNPNNQLKLLDIPQILYLLILFVCFTMIAAFLLKYINYSIILHNKDFQIRKNLGFKTLYYEDILNISVKKIFQFQYLVCKLKNTNLLIPYSCLTPSVKSKVKTIFLSHGLRFE